MVALRNRDRLLLIWPLVHDLLSTILAPESARTANALVRRAALGLMRICRRLLHYKADSAEALLRSLSMILRLDPTVAWDLAPAIAAEVGSLAHLICPCKIRLLILQRQPVLWLARFACANSCVLAPPQDQIAWSAACLLVMCALQLSRHGAAAWCRCLSW